MTTIPFRILKFESVIKKTNSGKSYTKINSSALYQPYRKTAFIISNLQKHFHQDNLSFVCLQFYKHNYLNTLVGNLCFCTQVKNQ